MTSKDKRPQRSNVNAMNLYLWNTVFSRSAKVASLNKKKMQPNDLIDLDAHQEAYVQKSSTSFVARGNGLFCSFATQVCMSITIHARQIYTESSTSRGLRLRFSMSMRNN